MATPPPPVPHGPGRYRADIVIVGAGVAGLYAASQLPPHLDVVIVDKGTPGQSGSSPWAQGGMAVALGPDDTPELHAADTIRAGDGLCDPVAVATLTNEAPGHVAALLRAGAAFDREDGRADSVDPHDLHLAREGGQTVARSVHRADATGAEMVRVLRDLASPLVSRLPGSAVGVSVGADRRANGLWILHPDEGLIALEARAILLATGGCGGLFAATTNQDHATADGVALSYLAGAAVRDNEFVQFHPTGLAVSGAWRFLLTEALRGAGATLHDADGHRFMVDRHPDAELAPRHVVAKAILEQEGGQAWLDATSISDEDLLHEFPTVLNGAREYGFDLATERVPVTPAAHYMVGGVRTDLDGRTSIPGLYAAGEVAATGVHGANRMAGNSLSEALVYGARAAAGMISDLRDDFGPLGPPPQLGDPTHSPEVLQDLRDRLRQAMWLGAGPVRDAASLTKVLTELDSFAAELGQPSTDPVSHELSLAITASRLIATSALHRIESRGGHYREDHEHRSAVWADVHLERVLPPAGPTP